MGTAPAFIAAPKLCRYGPPMAVILIGGSSNVGKTTAARSVAATLGADCVSIDDCIPVGLRASNRFHDDAIWDSDPDVLLGALRAHTAALASTVRELVEHARVSDATVVIEGEGIEPRLTTGWDEFDIRAVFVVETSVERLRATLAARDSPGARRYRELPDAAQHVIASMNAGYGEFIRAEAEATQHAWVSSQPWSTLAARVLAASELRRMDRSPDSMDA